MESDSSDEDTCCTCLMHIVGMAHLRPWRERWAFLRLGGFRS